MSISTRITIRGPGLILVKPRLVNMALAKSAKSATSTAIRDMRSEASKRVRARKKIKVKAVKKAIHARRNSGRKLSNIEFGIDVGGRTVSLTKYPHRKVKKGVKVEVNKGEKTLLKSAFIVTLKNGFEGVMIRRGPRSLPLRKFVGSRPVDALNHTGEAEGVLVRGRRSYLDTLDRLLKRELVKASRRR